MRAISALVIGFSLAVASANAAPTLQINSDGLLTGALNVDVGGTPYNVQFLDGTCATVLGSCIASSYTFHNATDALTAAQALLDQVFIDTGSYNFETNPHLTFGCEDPGLPYQYCAALTPFGGTGIVDVAYAENQIIEVLDNTSIGMYFSSGDTHFVDTVWAKWTSTETASVSEPSAFILLGTTVLLWFGAFLCSRKRKPLRLTIHWNGLQGSWRLGVCGFGPSQNFQPGA
jgi:hypothetical protein